MTPEASERVCEHCNVVNAAVTHRLLDGWFKREIVLDCGACGRAFVSRRKMLGDRYSGRCPFCGSINVSEIANYSKYGV